MTRSGHHAVANFPIGPLVAIDSAACDQARILAAINQADRFPTNQPARQYGGGPVPRARGDEPSRVGGQEPGDQPWLDPVPQAKEGGRGQSAWGIPGCQDTSRDLNAR